jgi:hypothetical protein
LSRECRAKTDVMSFLKRPKLFAKETEKKNKNVKENDLVVIFTFSAFAICCMLLCIHLKMKDYA